MDGAASELGSFAAEFRRSGIDQTSAFGEEFGGAAVGAETFAEKKLEVVASDAEAVGGAGGDFFQRGGVGAEGFGGLAELALRLRA